MIRSKWAILAIVGVCATMGFAQDTKQATKESKKETPQKAAGKGKPSILDLIIYEKDVVYGKAGNRELKLDIVRPKAPKAKKIPAIVFIHGGGWQGGDRSHGLGSIAAFAQ